MIYTTIMLYIINYTYIYVYNSLSPSIAIHLATTSGPSTPTGVTRNVGIPSRDAKNDALMML